MAKHKTTGHRKFLLLLIQLLGLSVIVLTIIWTSIYLGGFSDVNNPIIEFNWHPLLMTISMVFIYGNSILIYRNLRLERNKKLIFFHGVIHSLGFILFAIALQAAFDSHNLSQPIKPNLYSLHSWIGLFAVVLFICQWISGFLSFLLPHIDEDDIKNSIIPLDIYVGLFGFILAIASALMGLTQKAFLSMKYSTLPNSGRLVNVIGILIICFGCLIVFFGSRATKQNYKRRKLLPENYMLLDNTNN